MVRTASVMLLGSALFAAICAPASGGIYGTNPIPISVGPDGEAANGPSGGAAISGDNRRASLVAFHSQASNLTGGDGNGVSDVFAWKRPEGPAGLRLDAPARPAGDLQRVSVGDGGQEANGSSLNPSVDGSVRDRPGCVAFESSASNLAPGDGDAVPDVFVRDLRAGRTLLVSDGIAVPATEPSIDGDCSTVAFQAGGQAYLAPVRGGRPRSLGPGGDPDLSMDGSAVVWERGGGVALRRRGKTSTVTAAGASPLVSDEEHGLWAVAFESFARLSGNDGNPGSDVYMRIFGRGGGSRRTDLISAHRRGAGSLGGTSSRGGITAYAARRGIVTFATENAGGATLYYRNNHSGNIDDLAHASAAISEIATSARANFVAFSSAATGFPFDGNGPTEDVFFKHLAAGDAL
jgi:hypothetical protein